MMHAVLLLITSLAAALALPSDTQRIFGGSLTTVDQYPQTAAVLTTLDYSVFLYNCGSVILNNVAVLTAAHCHGRRYDPARYRVRVGSSFANSGGVVHAVQQVLDHPNYSANTQDSDIAVLRLASPLTFTDVVQKAFVAGAFYNLQDNQPVWANGWGLTQYGFLSEQLQHVQMYTVNQELCSQSYGGSRITDNMLCTGTPEGGRGPCTGDTGAPLIHNHVVVGIRSFGIGCSLLQYPEVYTRVSRFSDWIVANSH